MEEILIFLGSGASSPFGLPTMEDLVNMFEQKLREAKGSKITNTNYAIMKKLYHSIKKVILSTYGYVDLESIFSVFQSISEGVKYSDLGFTNTFTISRLGVDPRSNIFSEKDKFAAKVLLSRYKTYIRQKCHVKDSQERKITEVYNHFFDLIGPKIRSEKVGGQDGREYTYPSGSSIYTTNYDDVVERYWRGAVSINDLWRDKNGFSTLDVGKREANVLNLVKLHGSLDWFGLNDGTIVKLDRHRKIYGKRRVQGEYVLYPIQQKDLYLYPWSNLFYRFKEDLERKKTWLVIGYRFNDEFILNMFLEAMDRHHGRLILVNPDPDHIIDERFEKHKDHIRTVKGKFGIKQTTLDVANELS
jgi:hypothetical protein